ncbi:hypothetical protein R5W23_005643 [Gemmata sp. JC673]|uniref:Uncharacterized protein n=1 Tax=Gemmata algarum TaxID=2975278 RepID=A0ABU5EXH4_9BACT|nr:hypothetical protein [Gemmata algarum]MDY3558523.1 hypothetical protein [Gemmata algarum]
MEWFELQHESGCEGPAVYRLRLADANGQPIPIPTLLGGPDPSGIIDIGEAGSFERRRLQIISGVERCYGHSAGNMYRYLCQFTRLQEVHPGCRLQYSVRAAPSKGQAEDWEAEAIKEYIIRRGQLPILNRELPRAYDDVVWNAVWERVFGPVTDAPVAAEQA